MKKRFDKKILIFFLIVFLAAVGYFVSDLEKPKGISAQVPAPTEVSGWAWFGADLASRGATNPIGWISFNDANREITCGDVSYGVNADFGTGEISGYAWMGVGEDANNLDCNTREKTVGWLSFEATSGWPTGGSYNFAAKLIDIGAGKYEIQGWAPIISKDQNGNQTTVTWVRFRGANYSVVVNSDGRVGTHITDTDITDTECQADSTDHYAWAGMPGDSREPAYPGGLGWIDMCKVRFGPPPSPALSVVLEVATDSSNWLQGLTGTAPLNGVDLKATVSGSAAGRITYKFDCTNDERWDYTFNNIPDNPKIVDNACNYPSVGTYTAKVEVKRAGLSASDTATIWVLPPVIPTPTPTPSPLPLPIWREIPPF